MAQPRLDDDRMGAWQAFLTAHAAVTDVLDRELEQGRQLPLTWYDVLIQLQERGGRARMQELARSILFSKSGLTRLIDRMEKAGVVRREACSDDARGTYAVITAAGRRTLARARPVHHRGIEQHFARHLTDAEARAIKSGLGKVTRALHADVSET
jgi:DNA-binding MarR family transcriptional regulator